MEETGASVSEPGGDPTAWCPALFSAAHTLLGECLFLTPQTCIFLKINKARPQVSLSPKPNEINSKNLSVGDQGRKRIESHTVNFEKWLPRKDT